MRREKRKYIIRTSDDQDLIDLKKNINDYCHNPSLLEMMGKKYIIGAGTGDDIFLFSDHKDYTYILTSQKSMNYAGLEKIYHKEGYIEDIIFFQNVDRIENICKDFFDYSINKRCDILREYEN